MHKVLIADDDEVTRKLIQRAVEKMGYAAIMTSDGKRALEILQDNTDFSLLITDAKMPELEGRDLLEALRQNERLKPLPVIMVSGMVGPHYIHELLESGVARFLPKPLDLTMLHEYVNRALQRAKTERPS